ncbi:MAG: hypothetical protein KAR55_00630, partial [Thermoplasmatales archaeon]|nr:hypothetical protein [Thermoplasmatales archaeon]
MYKRSVGFVLLAIIVSSILTPATFSTDEIPWWNDDWSFQQEIFVPIDTSNEQAKYQPIDVTIEFINPCWAKDENEHSIRVVCWDERTWHELESQIYDLSLTDDAYVKTCNLVFLIPEYANGKEKYYVYYDDNEKPAADYKNHVAVEESYFKNYKIPTIPIEQDYFEITDEGYIVYIVAKDGTFIDPISQEITKLKPNSKDVTMKNRDNLASFGLSYWYKNEKWKKSSTIWKFISDDIFVDGNLMVKFGIVSRSDDDLFQSTVVYKYYYCPLEDKRIYTHVKHEVIKYPVPVGKEIDVQYVMLACGGIKSSALEELNFGEILPYLHIYSEEERVVEYDIPYPERNGAIITKEDDLDLGSRAWLSVDEGESGKAHAIIFASNNVIASGTGEQDGMEIEVYGNRDDDIPGVDGRFIRIWLLRNASRDEQIPRDFVVEFDAEYFTTENGGYKTVEKEVDMYQSLIKYQPIQEDNLTDVEEEDKYCLKTYIHFAPSFPLGDALSLASELGIKFSYITVELYSDEKFISSGVCKRLNVKNAPTSRKYIEAIKQLPEIFDFKNFSFFKYFTFLNLRPGEYLVKVWRENQLLGDKREYIGFQIVDLKLNTRAHIFCSPEGEIDLTILNQHEKGVENAQVFLMRDDVIIAEAESSSDGKAVIRAPCNLIEKYTLKVVYKGFLVHEEQIRLGFIRRLVPLVKTLNLEVHDFSIHMKDGQGNAPTFDVDMVLTSDEMEYPTSISVDNISNGNYTFFDLYPATYTLTIKYNSFQIENIVHIPKMALMTINLHNLKVLVKDNWDLPPGIKLGMILKSDEFLKPVVMLGDDLSAGEYLFADLYPANYLLKLSYKLFSIEKQVRISYENDEMLEVSFPAEFNITVNVFDSHGNLMPGVKVLITREGKELEGVTANGGNVTFQIPPANYVSKIYSNDRLIAERRIDCSNDQTFTIVTTEEPLYPFIIMALMIIMAIGAAYISHRKKDVMTFLKILAVALAIIAVVSPWWMIQGSSFSPQVETSTN